VALCLGTQAGLPVGTLLPVPGVHVGTGAAGSRHRSQPEGNPLSSLPVVLQGYVIPDTWWLSMLSWSVC
jgi:hypothetical protein